MKIVHRNYLITLTCLLSFGIISFREQLQSSLLEGYKTAIHFDAPPSNLFSTTQSPERPGGQCSHGQRARYLQHRCHLTRETTPLESILSVLEQHQHEWNETTRELPQELKNLVPNALIIDEKHKFLFCMVPKTGVTSYTSMMIQYSDKFQKEYPNKTAFDVYGFRIYYKREENGIVLLKKAKPTLVLEALRHYTKIMSTRNPFTRIYSFYKDKVIGTDCKKMIGFPDKIVKYTRNVTVANPKDACLLNITFKEFISYYRDHRHHDGNEHLLRVSLSCATCRINYDSFIRTETASSDQEHVVNTIYAKHFTNETNIIKSFKTNVRTSMNAGFSQFLQAFNTLSVDDIAWLQQFYADDLALYGYTVNLKQGGLLTDCVIEDNNGQYCC